MARIAVLEFGQSVESNPEHYISKPLASAFKSYFHNGKRAVEEVRPGLLRIVIKMAFSKLKALLKAFAKRTYVPMINPPRGPEGLLVRYPIPDERTIYL